MVVFKGNTKGKETVVHWLFLETLITQCCVSFQLNVLPLADPRFQHPDIKDLPMRFIPHPQCFLRYVYQHLNPGLGYIISSSVSGHCAPDLSLSLADKPGCMGRGSEK